MRRNLFLLLFFGAILPVIFLTTCTIKYSFTGASIAPDVKTFSVEYFPNRAQMVNPNLSPQITEALRDKLLRQTSLTQVENNGDLEFSGQITGYTLQPIAIQEGDLAAQNRLTITLRVKFVNNKDREQDWERNFSAYEDFDSFLSLNDVESDLVPEILEKLTDDIFNASLANW